MSFPELNTVWGVETPHVEDNDELFYRKEDVRVWAKAMADQLQRGFYEGQDVKVDEVILELLRVGGKK